MFKYISLKNGGVLYLFNELDIDKQADFMDWRPMTNEEIKKHEAPRETEFHTVWNGEKWLDSRTPEQIVEYNRTLMPTLAPMDFDLKLNKFGLYQQVQDLIKTDIELSIAYNRALYFSRTDPFIEQARITLDLTHEQIDEMWMS